MSKVAPEWRKFRCPKDSRYAFSIHTIHGTGPTDIWLGASRYNLHFDGTAFVPAKMPWVASAPGAPSGCGPADVWAVGAQGSVAHFDGTSWTEQKLDGIEYDLLYVLAWPHDVYVTAGGNELHRFDGKAWRKDTPESPG